MGGVEAYTVAAEWCVWKHPAQVVPADQSLLLLAEQLNEAGPEFVTGPFRQPEVEEEVEFTTNALGGLAVVVGSREVQAGEFRPVQHGCLEPGLVLKCQPGVVQTDGAHMSPRGHPRRGRMWGTASAVEDTDTGP